MKLLNSNSLAFNANLNGKDQLVTISKVDTSFLGAPIHVALQRVKRNTKTEIIVPVKMVGERDSKDSAVVQLHVQEIKIKANPSDIPNSIDVDIANLKDGDMVRAKDLVFASGIEFVDMDDEDLIVDCQIQKIVEEELVADTTETVPEIVGEAEEKKE
jgi:large subunit ribosomal protein L25